jgi:hypothetical protein
MSAEDRIRNVSRLVASGVSEARAWDLVLRAEEAGKAVARKVAK